MNKNTNRWKLDVLVSMSVTRFVIHFEMSALNAVAPENAVGVYVNAVDVEPEQEKKKPKIVREPPAHGTSN